MAVGLGAAIIGIGVAERSKEQRRLVVAQSSTAPVEPPALLEPEPAPIKVKTAPKTISPI